MRAPLSYLEHSLDTFAFCLHISYNTTRQGYDTSH